MNCCNQCKDAKINFGNFGTKAVHDVRNVTSYIRAKNSDTGEGYDR